ncbi:MAG: transglutaminase domain-containing protein [Huintestinicola sp.]
MILRLRRTKTFCILSAVTASLLTGCLKSDEPLSEPDYTVISDGKIITEAASEEETEAKDKYADVSSTELYVPQNMITKYASLDYDPRHTDVYNDVVETMAGFETSMLMPLTISVDDYVNILETVRCEQLMLFYVGSRNVGDFNISAQTFEMNFEYKYSVKETNIMLMETEDAAKAIFDEYIYEGMSDYEKLKAFHDYLVLNCESSTEDPYSDSIYGALVRKKALCEGYAKAFSYLCNIAGIENMIVTGYTDVDHMWNMVKVDGNWYHVDVGWDSPDPALAELYPDMVLYQYFLADDSVIEKSRTVSTALCTPPSADSDKMSYYVHENKYAEDYAQALEIIEEGCRRCVDSGDKYFMIKLASEELYEQTTERLKEPDENGISDIDRIMDDINYSGKISYIDYYKAHRVIIFVLEE